MKTPIFGLLLAACCLSSASALAAPDDDDGLPKLAAIKGLETPDRPSFGACAAYFFTAARGHSAPFYDSHYSAGEFSLNAAVLLHGAQEGNRMMEKASAVMMDEMGRDWQKINVLDRHHAPPCEALMRDAGYVPPR